MHYILIMLMWSASVHAGNGIAAAEFNSQAACESAAKAAASRFNGFTSSLYYVCEPKNSQ